MKKQLADKYVDEFPIVPVVGTGAEKLYAQQRNKESAINIALREGRERYLSKL